MAAKEIILLTQTAGPRGDQNITAVFWFPVPTGNQIPIPGTQSAWRGASNAENLAIQGGTILEVPFSTQYPASWTTAQIESALQIAYAAQQTIINTSLNPNLYYGQYWDGTTWHSAALSAGRTSVLLNGSATISTSGTSTIIGALPGTQISIYQAILTAPSNVSVTLSDSQNNILLPTCILSAGIPLVLPQTGNPWWITGTGNALIVNLSVAVAFGISGWYTQA